MFDRNREEDNQDIQVAMLQPHGVAVYLEAYHLRTQMRGVRESLPLTRTTFWRVEYESNAELRAEFFNICGVRL
jgi:GTP cyclohydrolase I